MELLIRIRTTQTTYILADQIQSR